MLKGAKQIYLIWLELTMHFFVTKQKTPKWENVNLLKQCEYICQSLCASYFCFICLKDTIIHYKYLPRCISLIDGLGRPQQQRLVCSLLPPTDSLASTSSAEKRHRLPTVWQAQQPVRLASITWPSNRICRANPHPHPHPHHTTHQQHQSPPRRQ